MGKLVSVIITTFGRPEFIDRAVRSVLAQTYSNIEVIVVDDNPQSSPDRTATHEVIARYVAIDSRVRYLPLTYNHGGALARNAGVAVSEGELITFLDDDDYYLPEKVAVQVEVFENTACDVCNCSMIALDNGRRAKYIPSYPRGDNLRDFLIGGSAFTPMIMVKRKLFFDVGGFFDTPRFQDHIFMIRLLSHHPKVVLVKDELFVHTLHLGKRVSHSPKSLKAFKIRKEFEDKYSACFSLADIQLLREKQRWDSLEIAATNSNFSEFINILFSLSLSAPTNKDLLSGGLFLFKKRYRTSRLIWAFRRILFSEKID